MKQINHNQPSPSRVVITGVSGFIGQHLIKALEQKGSVNVSAIPREIYHNRVTLNHWLKAQEPDWIFHLAAFGNMSHQDTDSEQIYQTNVTGLFHLLQAARSLHHLTAFINISSSSVILSHPTIYSSTKAAGEAIAKAFTYEYGMPIVSIRPYSVYGEGEADHRLIPTIFKSCIRGEEMKLAPDPVHDWIYVSDLVKELIQFAQSAHTFKGHVFDIGTGQSYTNQEVVDLIEQITKRAANIRQFSRLRSYDSGSWQAALGIYPHVSLLEGLKKCFVYYNSRYGKA